MTVCDVCKSPDKRAGEFRVSVSRVAVGAQRATSQTVKVDTVELCDGCVDELWRRIEKALPNHQATAEGTGP